MIIEWVPSSKRSARRGGRTDWQSGCLNALTVGKERRGMFSMSGQHAVCGPSTLLCLPASSGCLPRSACPTACPRCLPPSACPLCLLLALLFVYNLVICSFVVASVVVPKDFIILLTFSVAADAALLLPAVSFAAGAAFCIIFHLAVWLVACPQPPLLSLPARRAAKS